MNSSPARRLPRPVVAGIGFASTIPALLAELPAKLPSIAITSAIEARTRYLEYLRAGEAILAGDGSEDGTAPGSSPDGDPFAGASAVDATDLPIKGYDELSVASIRARLPRLDAIDVEMLRDYERVHAKRLPVLTMLENRLAKLAADESPGH